MEMYMDEENSDWAERPPALSFDIQALENIILERRNFIVKINDEYEISRPLILPLLKAVRDHVFISGGSMLENYNLLHFDTFRAIIKHQITVKFKVNGEEVSFTATGVGEACTKEKLKYTALIRVATARATKDTLENLVGEDFIDRVIMSLELVQTEFKDISDADIDRFF